MLSTRQATRTSQGTSMRMYVDPARIMYNIHRFTHHQAGKSYLRQAQVLSQSESPNDAVQAYIEAANSFRKCNPEMSAKCYLSAIDIYNDMVVEYFTIRNKFIA